ncbi:MAG: diguanylate cyclase [Myxococcales bacterium]|nr:diguanylate cyclase [Myxococcales bacterium]
MRRPRARRRVLDPRVRLVAPVAALVGATAIGASQGGMLAGVALATGAVWAIGHHLQAELRRQRGAVLDVDAALLGRALQATRAATDDERRLITQASESVRASVQRTVALVRASLRATSVIVLWTRSRDGAVQIREAETSSDHLRPGPFRDNEGFLAQIGRSRDAVVLNRIGPGSGALPWYEEGHTPAHAVGAPLVRDGIPLGYLVIDRAAGGQPFDEIDAIAVREAAEQISLAVHMEYLVLEAAVAQKDIQALTAAGARLNAALTADDVCARALELFRSFAEIDDFVVTSVDAETGTQSVIFAAGPTASSWAGLELAAGEDLASRVVRGRESLPFSARAERGGPPVLGGLHIDAEGLLAFPLLMGETALGAVILANRSSTGFEGAPRTQIALLTHQVAAALTNALAYGQMVKAATTDGMTGLTNHRTFKERATESLLRVGRSGRPLSLIMCDIDHFKRVNDTHGHAVGDQVIRGVARVLARSARNVDVVARYGGEEFAILLEDAELEGAVVIANRIREAVKQLRFDGASGPFAVTLSLGAAPFHGGDLAILLEEADQALYAAKRGGRDRVCVAQSERRDAAE